MTKIKRTHSPEFKLKAVIETLKREKTAAQIASELSIHPISLSEWKKQFIESGAQIFSKHKKSNDISVAREKSELYEQIGRLKMEVEWLKKKLGMLN